MTLRKAITLWGIEAQTQQAAEEAAELIVALSHHKRKRACIDDVLEEIADMQIMLDQLKIVYGEARYKLIYAKKFERFQKKVEESWAKRESS